jgi:iron complex outermembrane receptor protein
MTRIGTFLLIYLLLFNSHVVHSQSLEDTLSPKNRFKTRDTNSIKEIVVTGYGSNRKLLETPASIVPITPTDLHKYSNTSLVPVLDAVPGVDFQERSPGNYRLSIRGSSLRSAFNVRNIKVYWNDIPYTDAGGTTWLTSIDLHSLSTLEIIKGPTGSAYGAGGGTILIRSQLPGSEPGIHYSLDAQGGSFGMKGNNLAISSRGIQSASYLNYSVFKADGYRVNSGIDRQMVNFSSRLNLNPKDVLILSAFYTDLHYQTPYGLTLAQYNANPQQARPATGSTPGAVTNQTGEYVRKFLIGATNQYTWNEHFENMTSIGLSPDQIQNKSVNGIEKTEEENLSIRSIGRYKFHFQNTLVKFSLGGEFINSFVSDRNYGNLKGIPDSIQSDDQLTNTQWSIFSNLEWILPHDYFFTLGASINKVSYTIQRLDYKPSFTLQTQFNAIASPRIALLKKFNADQSLYLSYSYGYSPPASTEVLPSTGIFNSSLQAEISRNLELGYRGSTPDHFIDLDLTLFSNQIEHSIIRRTDSLGQDFYLNNGSSVENGIEGLLRINPIQNSGTLWSYLSFYGNFTFNNFYFRQYILNGQNLSGNPFTGVSPFVLVSGMDTRFLKGFYANLNYHYSDPIPLNDQNTVKSSAYSIFGGKLGYKGGFWKSLNIEMYLGVDNAFNKHYS